MLKIATFCVFLARRHKILAGEEGSFWSMFLVSILFYAFLGTFEDSKSKACKGHQIKDFKR